MPALVVAAGMGCVAMLLLHPRPTRAYGCTKGSVTCPEKEQGHREEGVSRGLEQGRGCQRGRRICGGDPAFAIVDRSLLAEHPQW